MKFVKDLDSALADAINHFNTSILRMEIVEFYHSHGMFHMMFNTFGWKLEAEADGSINPFQSGWWSHFAINSDGTPFIKGSFSMLLPVMIDVYNKHKDMLVDIHWYKGNVDLFESSGI